MLDALEDLHERIIAGEDIPITPELICEFNRQVLKGTHYREGVVPGVIRTESVVIAVSSYQAAPAEDCAYLLEQLADWLNGPIFVIDDPQFQFALTLAKAVYAHLYITSIHPFGDIMAAPHSFLSS